MDRSIDLSTDRSGERHAFELNRAASYMTPIRSKRRLRGEAASGDLSRDRGHRARYPFILKGRARCQVRGRGDASTPASAARNARAPAFELVRER